MTAFNVVRFRVKPGQEQAFIDAHRNLGEPFPGMRRAALVKTGDRTFMLVGEWDKFDSLAAARPKMISTLDSFRHLLEDLGNGLGVTDPASGEVVFEMSR
ncbi:MAG TPA: antibiotic biosynthesis monooxygenase [Burkholderiaceae bacterium]|nr:antibiotic biosynthesis monooxygenase [Burkholderiaceae bacterium]